MTHAESLTIVPAAIAPEPRASLFALEENLLALIDCEELVTPQQEEEYFADLGKALAATVDKRQRVAEFLAHLGSQIELAKQERKRLEARQAHLETVQERLESFVVRTIEQLPRDAKGKLRRLEGHSVSLSACGMAASVEVLDEAALPPYCRKVEIKMPLPLWETILDSIDFDLRDKVLSQIGKPHFEASKTTILEAIEFTAGAEAIAEAKKSGALSIASEEVPGARLNINRHRLVIK